MQQHDCQALLHLATTVHQATKLYIDEVVTLMVVAHHAQFADLLRHISCWRRLVAHKR